MRVLVCGSRTFTDYGAVSMVLDGLRCQLGDDPELTVIEGGAQGADLLGRQWARTWRHPRITFLADWNTYGKAAGPIRNQQMLAEGKPDVVVGFKDKPESRGTDDMLRRARAAGIRTIEVRLV